MYFIKNIIFLANKQNISQNGLAKKINLPTSTIKSIFQGKTKNPTLEVAYKLSVFFNMNINYLIENDLSKE